jgi:hypothetical protein
VELKASILSIYILVKGVAAVGLFRVVLRL